MSEKRKYHHGNLRAELIETAAEMLSKEGLPQLTLRALGERIGVSRTAMYRHFPDKNALLCAVAEDGFNKLTERYRLISSDPSLDALTRLKKIGLAYIEFAITNPGPYRLMFGHEITQAQRTPGLISAAESTYVEFLSSIKALQAEYDNNSDPLPLAAMAWAAVHGLSTLCMDDHLQITSEAQVLPTLLVKDERLPATSSPEHLEFIENIINDFWRIISGGYQK